MARAPMPAPQPLESPAVRRSAMLARLLEEGRQPVEIRGGYGELAARLLGQGITQFASGRADKAAAAESEAQRQARIQGQAAILGLGGSSAPSALADAVSPPSPAPAGPAPVAPVDGAPLPPVGQMPPPTPMPAPQSPPQQEGIFGIADNERRLAESLIASGDEQGLAALVDAVKRRNISPDIQVAPDGSTFNASDPSSLGRRFRNVRDVRGVMMDFNDPNNVGSFIPETSQGEELVRDAQGNIIGIRNVSGSVQARGERGRADADAQNASRASYAGVTAGAEAAARAPYQFVNVQSPTGAPTTMSAASAAGGVFQGQTPADAIRAEGTARGEVEASNVSAQRARQAPERIQRYEEALRLIPKAITGFGADARLAGARALAATGNQDARDAVAATEVYQNLIGRDIGAIVRDMVGAANISNSDRELATRIAGGDTNITPQALTRIVTYELDRQRGYLAGGPSGGAPAGAPARPQSRADYDALPSGATFIAPDGTTRRKP